MFAEQLKALRKERKLSQAALAGILGITQQAVGKWEGGKSAPDAETLRTLADLFGVTTDLLLDHKVPASLAPRQWAAAGEVQVPVIGRVKAGYGALAFQEDYGTEPANVRSPEGYFYLIVHGDSMEPRIHEGDLALVRRQPDVESGDLAVVLVEGEEATLKRVIKKENAVILQAFNQSYQPQIFIGEETGLLTVVGKVMETKTRW